MTLLERSWAITVEEVKSFSVTIEDPLDRICKIATTIYLGMVKRKGLGGELRHANTQKGESSAVSKLLEGATRAIRDEVEVALVEMAEAQPDKVILQDTGRLSLSLISSLFLLQMEYRDQVERNVEYLDQYMRLVLG